MSKRLAICIGVNKYKNIPSAELRYARKDAEDIAAVLEDKARGGFDQIIKLFDRDATKDNIIATLNNVLLERKLTRDDLVLIFFSGHGAVDKGDNLFLAPHDVGKTVNVNTTVHIKDLEKLLDNTDAGTVIIMLDACHSGGAGKLLGHIKYDDNSNIVVVGATRFSESAWETPELEHGRFTEYLLRSINQKPAQGEWITLSQIVAFIQSEMEASGDEQRMEISTHTINQKIQLFRNPMYSLTAEAFIEQVKELCELAGDTVLPMQPNQTHPNIFVTQERRSFGRTANALMLCLNNDTVDITHNDIKQFDALFRKLKGEEQVTNAMVVTYNEVPARLKQSLSRFTEFRTINEIQRSLIDFERCLKQIVTDFERTDSERALHPPLKQIYVDLNAQVPDKRRRWSTQTLPVTKAIDDWLSDPTQPATIILSGYGTGKTTVSRKIAYDLALAYRSSPDKHKARIPLLFSLRKFPKFSSVDIEAFIIAHLSQHCRVNNPDFLAFQAMNEAGLFVLIFDGFDEMAVRADEDVIHRNFLEIIRLIANKNAKILITSRPEAFLTESEENEILSSHVLSRLSGKIPFARRIRLQKFTKTQFEEYLQKRVPLIEGVRRSGKDWTYYRDQIDRIIGIEDITKRPALLEVTLSTLPELLEKDTLVTRPLLYETYLSSEIKRQTVYKRRDYMIRGKKDRLALIQIVARHLYAEGSDSSTAVQIQELLRPEFTDTQRGDLEAYVRDFIACSFMIREGDNFRFSHRSFMEYLAAKSIAQEIETNTPATFRKLKLTPAVYDWLVDLEPPGKKWREILWNWLQETTGKDRETALYLGGNAITLLHLMGESLSRASFENMVLAGANLENAQCRNVCFDGCNLESVNFTGANLHKAAFKRACLDKSNLNHADLTEAKLFQASLRETKFEEACLDKSDLNHADLTEAKLIHASLREVAFKKARLDKSNLNHADLTKAKLIQASLREADITNAILSKANFAAADLTSAKMWLTLFDGKRFEGKPLREYIETSPFFNQAKLRNTQYSSPLPKGKRCFPAGTRINMADGSKKHVENIQTGDLVLSYNLESKTITSALVTEVFIGETSQTTIINNILTTTPSESVFTGDNWVEISTLREGDTLWTINGIQNIDTLEHISKQEIIYNFTVHPYHNFFVHDILVHNKFHRMPPGYEPEFGYR